MSLDRKFIYYIYRRSSKDYPNSIINILIHCHGIHGEYDIDEIERKIISAKSILTILGKVLKNR